MNHRKQKYRESLRCWIGHTSSYNPQGRLLMSHHWPKNVPVGRKSYTFKFDVPYDADVVFIRTPGNVNYNPVSEMTVRATFRPGGIGKTIPPAKPVLSAEILRKRGTLTADNPFRPIQLNLPKFSQLGPSGGNIVAMPDGKLLMAYTSGYAEQRKILLTASKDGKTWAKPWGMAHNSIFNTASPSMIVDDDGVIWMLYISKRFRYDFSSAGYYLWITKSLDGQAWSIPKPVKIQGVGKHQAKYQYVAQLTRRPDGKYCIFYNSHFGSGNSPGDIRELRLMALPITDSMYPNNTHATFDTNGRCYLVFDDFGRAIYYTHSDNMKTWLPLVKLAKKRKNSSIRFPQLFIDAKRVALVYGEHAGDWLRRGTITPNLLGLGRPIRITDGLVPVNGSRLMRNGDDMYLPAGGDYVPVLLHGRYRDIMGR